MEIERFTVSYAKTNENFQFQFPDDRRIDQDSTLYGLLCVLKNLFQRGKTVRPSVYLQEMVNIPSQEELNPCTILSKDIPAWDSIIKSGRRSNPALDFYKKIPIYFGNEFPFLQQLIIPEAYVTDIIPDSDPDFIGQQVDFYIPAAKLVIEIDGLQHEDTVQKQKDRNRDEYLRRNNIVVHRIPVTAFSEPSRINYHIYTIKSRLKNCKSIFDNIIDIKDVEHNPYFPYRLQLDLIIRYELLIIAMMQRGILDLNEKKWKISLEGYSDNAALFSVAMHDVMQWLYHLCTLASVPYEKPELSICDDRQAVRIDCDLFKFPDGSTIRNDSGIIFIRNDPYLNQDWFRLSFAKPIIYQVKDVKRNSVNHDNLNFFLKNIFGYSRFQRGQLPILARVLSCSDTIGILPTSGGKSLCYQMACLLQPCINFVICPLISLCHDQKYNLDQFNITRTAEITSNIPKDEKYKAITNLENGKYFFVWITPERFQSAEFRQNICGNDKLQFCYAILDEVHCLSEWGHDFRTAYLMLVRTLHKLIPETCLIGLTATISAFVLLDIMREFDIDMSNIIKSSRLDRPNLHFEVNIVPAEKRDDTELFTLLDKVQKGYKDPIFSANSKNSFGGLIFCTNARGKNNSADIVCKMLQERYKGDIAVYHSKIEDKDKIQLKFLADKIRLLTATKAFGMGVNKKNIRYTIHYGLPQSIEDFYQEAGRAGRDQNPADCMILYHQEPLTNKAIIEECFGLNTPAERVAQLSKNFKYDLRRVFYLLSENFRGIEYDFHFTCEIYKILMSQDESNSFLQFVNSEENIHNMEYPFSKIDTEKALYRLMILGIVDDWTINYSAQLISLQWHGVSYDEIKTNFLNYIKRYDPEKEYKDFNDLSADVRKALEPVTKLTLRSYIKALIIWQYENIYYQRRISIKHMMDLCEIHYSSPANFKKEVCRFLTVNTVTDYLDAIAEDPWDWQNYFRILEMPHKGRKKEKNVVKISYTDIMRSCERYLESYQALSGLDFVYGVSCAMCGVMSEEAQIRFESAVSAFFDHFSREQMQEIRKCLNVIIKDADENSQWWISEILSDLDPDADIRY